MAHTLKEARQYIQGKLADITGAPVHEYKRLVRTEEDLKNIAATHNAAGDLIYHGWQISRLDATNESDTNEGEVDFTFLRLYRIQIEGYYGLDDSQATELTFQDLIESILGAFDTAPTLDGHCDYTYPMEVQQVSDGFYGSVGVHYCQLVLTVVMKRDRIA